jgi:hypothetical protein
MKRTLRSEMKDVLDRAMICAERATSDAVVAITAIKDARRALLDDNPKAALKILEDVLSVKQGKVH